MEALTKPPTDPKCLHNYDEQIIHTTSGQAADIQADRHLIWSRTAYQRGTRAILIQQGLVLRNTFVVSTGTTAPSMDVL